MMLARLNQPSGQRSKPYTLPASIRGINATRSLAFMEPDECYYCFNIIPRDFGMQVREGYIEWANGWIGGPAKTVISFQADDGSGNLLWVASPEGIFDVTAFGTTSPTQVVNFPSSGGNAGICSYIQYTNDAGNLYLLLCDGENGYYTYEAATTTWTKITMGAAPGQIDGVDPDSFDYLMIFKNRIWFIERASANAWYLAPGSITGTATRFNFGTQLREGGDLRQLVNWTLDGGDGIDDYLVALSGAGDVVIYQGYDPATASQFQVVGTWFIGELPAGRRVAHSFGGEVYILSVYGLLPLSQLLNGSSVTDPGIYATYKVSPYLRAIMDQVLNDFGWQVHVHPRQGLLYVNTPDRKVSFSQPTLAFVMYYAHMSWGVTRGLDKNHTANWQGEIFWCSSQTDKIFVSRGYSDGVYLDPETDGDPQPIEWDLLTSYQYIEGPINKRVQYVRPIFISSGNPSYEVKVRYDFDISQQTTFPVFNTQGNALWNTGVWGLDVWAGGAVAFTIPTGGTGMGRAIAFNVRGRSSTDTTLTSFEVIYDSGGLM